MQGVDKLQREKFVGHGEIQADEFHAPGPGNSFGKVRWINIEGQVFPIEAEFGDGSIVHRGRGRVPDRMPKDRAVRGAGIYRHKSLRHAPVIGTGKPTAKN